MVYSEKGQKEYPWGDWEESCNLRARAERLMGWPEGSSCSLPLAMVRELVREKSPKLYYLISKHIQSGRHLLGEPLKARR